MSSSVKVINTITETNSQAIVDAVDSLMVSGHQTDSFTLGAGLSVISTTYNINDYKALSIISQTSTDASASFQVQWSNDQSTWFFDNTTNISSITNPSSSTTQYQGNYSQDNNYGKFMRIEYYNPAITSTDFDVIINFLH